MSLSFTLIFGRFGAPRLGAVGCAVASLVAYWTLFVAGTAYTARAAAYRPYAIRRARPHWPALKEQLALGILMGFPTRSSRPPSRSSPSAVGMATATITAQAIGAGDLAAARRTGAAGLRFGVALAAVMALAQWGFRHEIIALYTNDAAVAGVKLSLVVVVPVLIHGVALWGLGVIGGFVVAFHPVLGPPRGAPGMWMMQALALCLASLLLLGVFRWVVAQRS